MSYYDPADLEGFGSVSDASPELGEAFFAWYGQVFAEGELSAREKALIALAVAHSEQCPYCIDAYTKSCLEQGCSKGELTEAVHVAAAIKGGAAMVHGVQMRKRADELSM